MKHSLYLLKIGGIKIYMHWTFPAIIFWIVISNLSRGLNASQVLWSVVFILALFGCVVLHELGHALTARRYGIQTRDITLYPIGGVARLEKMPERPRDEFLVALAGPAVNLVIVVILLGALKLTRLPTDFAVITHVSGENFLLSLAIVNLWLALFNLIPAFPMDGGRVLRALLSMRLNRVVATRIAARIGQALAMFFVFAGFIFNPFLIFIGLFVFLGAMAESEQVQIQSALQNRTIEEVTMKEIPVLTKEDAIGKAVDLLLNGQAKNFLVMDGTKPFGSLGRDAIIRGLQDYSKDTPVEKVADKDLVHVDLKEPIENALLLMQTHRSPLLVVTKNDELYGITDMENIAEYIMVINASANIRQKGG